MWVKDMRVCFLVCWFVLLVCPRLRVNFRRKVMIRDSKRTNYPKWTGPRCDRVDLLRLPLRQDYRFSSLGCLPQRRKQAQTDLPFVFPSSPCPFWVCLSDEHVVWTNEIYQYQDGWVNLYVIALLPTSKYTLIELPVPIAWCVPMLTLLIIGPTPMIINLVPEYPDADS